MQTQAATVRTSIPVTEKHLYARYLESCGYQSFEAFRARDHDHLFLLFLRGDQHRRYLQDRSEQKYLRWRTGQ